MTKRDAKIKVEELVEEAIKSGNYGIIRKAEDLAIELGIETELEFYDDYLMVGDDRFDFNGIFD